MLILENRTLSIAVAASVLLHGALLAVRFAPPDSFKFKPIDPGLEVILVNAKHDRKPVKAEALAQANLDGGGNADAGRAKSPLPDMRRTQNGDGMKTARQRIEELQEMQQRMMAQLQKKTPLAAPPVKDPGQRQETPARTDGVDATETMRELLRQEAEINKRIEDENKRPKRTYISPSTREAGHAFYRDTMQRRIENIGTLNFPQKDGRKIYGDLTLSISVYQDGSLYRQDGDGGITVDRSSGVPALDDAAKRIVRRSAPFGVFPPNMRTNGKDDVWIFVFRFRFTNEDTLEADFLGGRK
ncbi:MAG TPA: energy transducer TonB [Noviherbaspirillum sp.]|uniref:energy transducer TonB n=1 Tax=Noviherbaspirillum sp. TaxID=1926288 RepID=UPI002D6BC695|nr:energy transducer TonB [Noviherbaspirillum sp.]HYD95623.1 energy transducer TonB [Noviherbaspirillum sp.]